MKNKNNITSTPKVITGISFNDMMSEVIEKGKQSEENYQKTGLCQANVEVSEGVWEPCKRLADPKNPHHFCKECQKHTEDMLKELHESQGPGDFLISL